MSSFYATMFNPDTQRHEEAWWDDNHFGPHRYGITFDCMKWWQLDDLQVAIAQAIEGHSEEQQ